MGTVIGIECADGTVLAGDRTRVDDGVVKSERARHVFDLGDAGAAAVGERVDEFARRLETEVDGYRTERNRPVRIDPLARMAASILEEAGGESAIVSAPDEDGRARLRTVGPKGQETTERVSALGSGASIGYGRLEAADLDVSLDAAASLARETLAVVAERDPGTGDDVDLWQLTHRSVDDS